MSDEPEPSRRRLFLLDGHSLSYRAFFALPTSLATSSGQVTNAVYGFTSMLIKLLAEERPELIAVAFDVGAPTVRLDKYAEYKAGRPEAPDEFRQQLGLIVEVLETLRIPVLGVEGHEADDVIATLAVRAGVHYADLGGNTGIVFQQLQLDETARAHGISAIPDCGLAPGMVNILAAAGIRALDRTDQVRCYVGGLPQHPRPPLHYTIVYSLEGVLDYYTTTSWILRDGELRQVEALSEIETVQFPEPPGTLEAFHTAGGLSTLPWTYQGRVRTMEYKTLRYPGHAHIMRAIRDLGLLDTEPVQVRGELVAPRDVDDSRGFRIAVWASVSVSVMALAWQGVINPSLVVPCLALITLGFLVSWWRRYRHNMPLKALIALLVLATGFAWAMDFPSRRSLIMDLLGPQRLTSAMRRCQSFLPWANSSRTRRASAKVRGLSWAIGIHQVIGSV